MNLIDNFDRVDSVNGLAGSTLSGGGAVWEKIAGGNNAGISANKAIIEGSGFATRIVAESGSNQGELTYTRINSADEVQVFLRYVDSNNYLRFQAVGAGTTLNKVVNGVLTQIHGSAGSAAGVVFKLILTDAHGVTLLKDGVSISTASIPELYFGTKHGFALKPPSLYDNFSFVDSTPAGAPKNIVPNEQSAFTAIVKAIPLKVNDLEGNLATTRLTVVSGLINVSLAGGATISVGTNNSAGLTLSGTQAQINAALATVTYTSNAAFTGIDTLTVLSSDSAATPLTDSDTVSITVTSPNTAPVNTVPASQTASANSAKAITGISVSDADSNLATTRLTVTGGTLNVSLTGGATISLGANNTADLTLSGTQTQINAALGTLSYLHSLAGSFTLTVLSTDSGSPALTDSDTVAITVTNTAPLNTVPAAQTLYTNTTTAITGVSTNDTESNLATTRISVVSGLLNVSLTGGATISLGANNSSALTLSGSQTQINAALATISYQSNVSFTGADVLTVVSTDTAGLTDTDTVAITVADLYAIQGTDFTVPGVLSNGVTINGSGEWVTPKNTTTWTFTLQTLSDSNFSELAELITLTLGGITATGTINNVVAGNITSAGDVFITESAYGLLSPAQRTAAETGGGYPLFIVTKNAADTTNGFDVLTSSTINGTYTNLLSNQAFTPTALVNGVIDKIHPTFAITDESNYPTTIAADTKGLLYDSDGQREWVQLNSLATRTAVGETARVLENVGFSMWDSLPILVRQEASARVAILSTPSLGTLVANGITQFYKIIPKVIGGASADPALIPPIALTISSKSRRPYPVRKALFYRNEDASIGLSFPDKEITEGRMGISIFPSARNETATSTFLSPAPAFEAGVTKHVDFKTVGGETLIRTKTIGSTNVVHYEQAERAADIARFATQVELYTKLNGIESERFVHVVKQAVPENNGVTQVTPTFLSSNIRVDVRLSAFAGGTSGTGQENGVYLIKMSGTLFPNINMDAMSIDAAEASIFSYDKARGELWVVAPRALTDFVLIVPYTGTGTITVFAGYRLNEKGGDVGLTSSATI